MIFATNAGTLIEIACGRIICLTACCLLIPSESALSICICSTDSKPLRKASAIYAPAVTKGNTSLLDWLNEEIETLGKEQFFHKDYEETLADAYGLDYEDTLVVESGVVESN